MVDPLHDCLIHLLLPLYVQLITADQPAVVEKADRELEVKVSCRDGVKHRYYC